MLKSDIASGTSLLSQRGWLADTPQEFSEAILAHCHWRQVAAGAAIQHAGDSRGGLTGLARGTITVTTSLTSPDTVITHISHPGQWFGFITVFGGRYLPNSVAARSDVILAHMSKAALEQLLANRPEWWRHVGQLGVLYGNLAVNTAADLMIRDSHRRCIAALLRMADCRFCDNGNPGTIEAPLSQEELAALSNLSRTSVSSILHELEIQGLITLGYRCVTLNDTRRLRADVDDV